MIDKDPRHLHPLARAKLTTHMEMVARFVSRGFLQETWRDPGEQLRLYGIGRDGQGHVIGDTVTDAKPGFSWHNLMYYNGKPCSLAYHIAIRDQDGIGIEGFGRNTLSERDIEDYTFIGRLGEHLGLTWGGRWRSRDLVHFELRIAPLSHVRAALHAGNDLVDLRRVT